MISIIIPTYNHLDCLRPCLESIIKYTSLDQVEIIVVANGCTDGTEEYVKSLGPAFKIISFPQAIGYPTAINAGLKLATGEYIVLLNNDTVILDSPKDEWLNILQGPFLQTPDCGVTGPSALWSAHLQAHFLIFFCAMISRKCFEAVGLLDTIFTVGGGEDMNFCFQALQKGFKLIQVPTDKETQTIKDSVNGGFVAGAFPIWHRGEVTVKENPDWETIFHKNEQLLIDRYASSIPRVAVITPLYNDRDRILEAIKSVNDQESTGINIMHYIYSDAGIDDSCQIVDEYIKNHYGSRIKFFKGIENKGQSFSRNFLIEQALADNRNYIAFLDADDKWLRTDHISSSLKLMRENISDVIYGRPRCFNDKGEEGHPFGMAIPKIFIGKQLEYLNYIWVSGVVCKAECFKNNPFDSTLDGLEDWDMWYRLFKQGFKFKPRDTLTFAYYDKFQGEATKSVTKMDLIRAKHKFDLTQTRLNVACGQDYQQGYINADLYEYTGDTKLTLDACFDAREIPYDDNTVDEIRALYIIEHFTFHEVAKVLGEWYRVLKPGGKLVLETPDFLESCRAFVNGDEGFRVHIYGHFFCFPWMPGQTHKFLFTETQLRTNLTWAGFKDITRISPMSNYVTSDIVNLFLAVEAFK